MSEPVYDLTEDIFEMQRYDAELHAELDTLRARLTEAEAERDRFREHSIILNHVAWKMEVALGNVDPENADHVEGPVVTHVDEVLGRLGEAEAIIRDRVAFTYAMLRQEPISQAQLVAQEMRERAFIGGEQP